jgi:hypothetical protein
MLAELISNRDTKPQDSGLGGVVVSVLATGPKSRGFKAGRSHGYLRGIKIRSTLSFGWEVKPEIPCRQILWSVKDPLRYVRCQVLTAASMMFRVIFWDILPCKMITRQYIPEDNSEHPLRYFRYLLFAYVNNFTYANNFTSSIQL